MTKRLVAVYPRFERFWHWAQVLLVLTLLFTGLGISGLHGLVGFGLAVQLHVVAALCLILLWIFAVFWHLTTGTWRHYVPSAQGLFRIARFYAVGAMKGERHPYRRAYWRKHNPLQGLTYLALKLVLFPVIWVTGIALLSYNFWEASPGSGFWLNIAVNLHLLVAYVLLAFVLLHVYLLTIGGSFGAHVKPMLNGFDEVDLTPEEEAYLTADEPWRIR